MILVLAVASTIYSTLASNDFPDFSLINSNGQFEYTANVYDQPGEYFQHPYQQIYDTNSPALETSHAHVLTGQDDVDTALDNRHRYSLLSQFYTPINESPSKEPLGSPTPSDCSRFDAIYNELHNQLYNPPMDGQEENSATLRMSDLEIVDHSAPSTSADTVKETYTGWHSRRKGPPAPWKRNLRGSLMKIYNNYIQECPQTLPNAIKHLDHVADPALALLLINPDPLKRKEAARRIFAQCEFEGMTKPYVPKPKKKVSEHTKAKGILGFHLNTIISAIMQVTKKDYAPAYRLVMKAYKYQEELSTLRYSVETHDRIVQLILQDIYHNERKGGRPLQPKGAVGKYDKIVRQ